MRASLGPVALAALVSAAACGTGGAGGAEPAHKRWAVVSSAGLRESGFADLVAVELLRPGRAFDLVERDRIGAVLKEHRLEATLGSEGVGARLRMGRLLGADALVLLSEARAGGARHVKLVVSDCRHGARLAIEFVPLVEGEMKEAARSVARTVDGTRTRFARGVERIIGVSHFVSRNLVHDYDHLQAGLAYLLESALAAYPGVAVIETEEAHAVRREIELAGGAVRRVVPLVVEGGFEVAGAASEKSGTVRIEARVSDATRVVRTIRRRDIPLGEAAAFVRAVLAPAVVGLSEGAAVKPFPAEEQFARLASRADVFSGLGAWEHSTGLREAAVLLRPRSAEQRTLLVEEHSRIIPAKSNWPEAGGVAELHEVSVSACGKRLVQWRLCMAHLEYLIRNGLVCGRRATELSGKALEGLHTILVNCGNSASRQCRRGTSWYEKGIRHYYGHTRPRIRKMLAEAEPEKRRFLRSVYPLILELEGGEKISWKWAEVLFENALTRCDHWNRTLKRDDLLGVLAIMRESLPDNGVACPTLLGFLRWGTVRSSDDTFSDADYVEFLEGLAGSGNSMLTLYGRYGLFHRMYMRKARKLDPSETPHAPPREITPELLAAWRDVCARVRKHVRDTYVQNFQLGHYKMPGHEEFIVGRGIPGPTRPADETKELRFEEVPMRVKRLSGKVVDLARLSAREYRSRDYRGGFSLSGLKNCRIEKCTRSLDVMFSRGVVLFLRQEGLLEEMLVDGEAYFDDAAWDGRNVWIATRWKGIRVLRPSGEIVTKIGTDQGLPPSDRAIMLHALQPGKVFAVGSFGKHFRGWCAIVELAGKAVRVNVFHKATRLPLPDEDPDALAGRTDLVFGPPWVHELDHGRKDGGRILLVGRLQIDLEELTVSVAPFEYGRRYHRTRDSCFSRNGVLVMAVGAPDIRRWTPTEEGGEPRYSMSLTRTKASTKARILACGDEIVIPGHYWYRLDPVTLEPEQLTEERTPYKYMRLTYGVSGHYGLVAWGDLLQSSGVTRRGFFRVHVHPPGKDGGVSRNAR